MADRPILFSAPMVSALLDDRKFQTRRIINIKPTGDIVDFVKIGTDQDGRPVYEMKGHGGEQIYIPQGKNLQTPHFSPRVAVGDRLYVREEFSGPSWFRPKIDPPVSWPVGCDIWYWADGNPPYGDWTKPKRAMHMPRWMSRLTLIVTDVRVQRLQDISRDDAIAEGLIKIPYAPVSAIEHGCDWGFDGNRGYGSPITAYAMLWNHINGDGAWDANPWVSATSFEIIKQNIDEVRP